MNFHIVIPTTNKAKQDIDRLWADRGFLNLAPAPMGRGGAARFLLKLLAMAAILVRTHRGDTLFLQYPMKKFYRLACGLAHAKGCRVVTIIHDLGAFRRHKLTAGQENRRLSATDFLIVHNGVMRAHLLHHGFKGGMHSLDIFDYLSPEAVPGPRTPHTPWRVVYAGYLGEWRNAFLYHVGSVAHAWEMDLYGNGFDATRSTSDHLHYHGFMASDTFIRDVEADFGLVWDGGSTDECNGAWGEYLKINNPHKTSFYLRAGLPVIVWAKAAMAPFVEREGVGIVVETLADIDSRLASLAPQQYAAMQERARAIGQRLAEGYYVGRGIAAAEQHLSDPA